MDDTLNATGQLKVKMEHAQQKQHMATLKIKDHKKNVVKLKEQVGTMEQQLEAAKAEAERNRVDPEVRARYDKLVADHSTLQATHAWTKSSLDSTLAAQEEYRKGYTSLQAAYRKTKTELDQKARQAESARDAREEAAKIHATLPEKEAEFKQDLKDSQDALKNIMDRQKKKSRAVLDKMLAGQSSTCLQLTLTGWQKAISDEKFWRENAKNLEEAQKKLQEYQGKKKNEASKVLDRMSAANDTSLMGLMIQNWSKYLQEAKKEREEAAKFQDKMKDAKLSARKTLEQNLNSSATGILTNAMKDWINHYREWKKVGEMKNQTEAKLNEYKSKKKGEQESVIERMAGEQSQALITRMFLSWSMTCLDESSARHAHNDLTNQVDDLESQLKALKDAFAKASEDLLDTTEEIEESRKKNAVLRHELRDILNVQDKMDASLKEMDD